MVRFASLVAASFVAVTVALLATPGCSNQGEGQRCDLNNDSDDCESGLTCQNIEGQPKPLCCPPAPQQPSVAECFAGQKPLAEAGADSAVTDAALDAQPDTSTIDAAEDTAPDTSTIDAAEDTAPDATDDAEQDSGTDAAGD